MEMDISIFFASFLGSFFVIFGLLFIVTKQLGKTIEMTDDKAFVISTGYLTVFGCMVALDGFLSSRRISENPQSETRPHSFPRPLSAGGKIQPRFCQILFPRK